MRSGRRLVTTDRLIDLAEMALDGAAEGADFELPCREMAAILHDLLQEDTETAALAAALELASGVARG